jgi:hypothetical protein
MMEAGISSARGPFERMSGSQTIPDRLKPLNAIGTGQSGVPHMVRPHGLRYCCLGRVQVGTKMSPLLPGQIIWSRCVSNIEYEQTLAAIRLVCRQIKGGHGEAGHQVPVFVGALSRRVESAFSTTDKTLPL